MIQDERLELVDIKDWSIPALVRVGPHFISYWVVNVDTARIFRISRTLEYLDQWPVPQMKPLDILLDIEVDIAREYLYALSSDCTFKKVKNISCKWYIPLWLWVAVVVLVGCLFVLIIGITIKVCTERALKRAKQQQLLEKQALLYSRPRIIQ